MDYILHKASGGTAELNKQVGGFSAISSVLVKLNHNKVGEMELKLSAPAYTIAIGDWVEAKGKRFYCLNNWKEYIPGEFSVTLLTVEGFGLTSNFYHCTESFDTVYSWSRDNNKVDTGSLKTFGEFFCYNVNYQQNTRLFKLGSFPEGSDTDYRVLSFTNENALSCLYEFCTAYKVRYEFVLNEDEDSLYILNFYAEDVVYPETFSYEKQGGLYDLNISNADGQVYTEFVVLGSEDNLPADYPYTELHLSDTYPLSMVKYPDKYATWGRSVKELRLDVKPSRVGIVTSEVAADLNSFIDSDLIGATWTPVGGVIHIVEGPLLGFEFNVSDFNATTGKVTVEQNTEGATTLPEAEYYKFTVGTKYTITGIPLPESYLTDAEARLLTESEPHRLYWSDARYDARIRVEPKFLETNGEIEAGMLLPVVHEAINLNRNFRVQSITYDPRREQYYDVTEITISDFRQESIADSQHKAIRTALHRLDNADKVSTSIKTSVRNLDTYIDGAFADGLVSEAEAKAIEKYINIVNSQKSDIDAQFTALYANSYLSGTAKTNLNTAKTALNTATTNLLNSINTAIADGSTTAAEKADVDSKFTAFNSALSTYQTRVEEAKGAIEAAIEAAAEATAAALDDAIQVGGRNLLLNSIIGSPIFGLTSDVLPSAGLKDGDVITVQVWCSATGYNSVACYRDNGYVKEADISPVNGYGKLTYTVYPYTSNANNNGSIRFITAGSNVRIKVERGNKPTDWTPAPEDVQAEIDSASDAVNALDTFVNGAFKDGLVSEAEAKAIEKYINIVNSQKSDIDAQFTALYANSYLSGTAKTNLNTAKTALNTATTNLLNSINTAIADGSTTAAEKADVDSKFTAFNSAISTYQTRVEEAQKSIETAIETSAKAYADTQLGNFATTVTGSLSDLQNQIDGNITTWFYAYVPTTANAPANTWTTTALKNQHIGDLFYVNNDSLEEDGFCYRWTGTAWELIKDTQITKALADAAAAQDTADSKRRVFVATPTTPYDIGDLWLKSGDLYKCKVTRLTGSYVASDWEKGVKYTDDTVANAAAAAAAAAQSAADDAQDAADAANALLTNIASDSKLTASEKQAAKKEWDIIQAEKTKNDTQADLYSVSKTAYTNAYNALSSYLSTLLSNLTTTSDITGSEFRGKFKDYYNARTDLLNAISNAAKAAAEATAAALDDAIQVGGRNYIVLHTSIPNAYIHKDTGLPSPSTAGAVSTDWIEVEPSTTYTWTVLPDSIGLHTDIGFFDENKTFIIRDRQTNSMVEPVVYNFTTTASTGFLRISHKNLGGAKLEKGNKATDWTPAPEDVQAEIDSASDAVNALDTFVNGAFKDGLVSEAEAKAIEKYINIVNSQKSDIDAQFTALYANSYLSGTAKTNLNSAKEALNTSVSNLLDSIATAITDGAATTAEKADVDSKFTAFNSAISTYQTRVEQAQEAISATMKTAAENASKNYADSLADGLDSDSTAKVTAAKNALAAKFGYTDWSAMEAAASLIGGMTTSAGLINANVIDVTTLAALDAFIEELVVIKLETAVDEDGTKVRIDADAVDGRAGVLLEESTGDKGIKLYYKDSSGVPVFVMYSVSTGELLEFLANRMKFSKGSTKDITIDSNSTILQLRSGTSYAQITPTSLRVDGLATAPVGKGHFWVDTEGYVHHGMEVPPTTTYSFDIDVTYPTSRSDIAASGGVATFTVKLITTTNGTPDAGVLVDLDTGYPSVTSSPTGTSFSITRTGTGTYSITAASRGTVESVSTAAVISVKYTPSGATQQSTSFNILQEANSKTKTDEDTGITLSISTIYDDSSCPASGDTWTVTASGESGGREKYTYTSGASEWVSLGGTPITASLISITTSGTGLSGSGTGAGTRVMWADRGIDVGERRSGTITASYSGESVQETVYQEANAVESVTDKTINWVKLDGTNGNIEVDADAGYTLVTVELGFTDHYTSGSTSSYTTSFGHTLSVSGTGFTKFSNGRVDYTENTAQSTRNGVITITYGDATPVQRTITQAAASATTYQILGEITYSSGSQIPASGGTATLTVTKQTYINGVHQSASDVLIDCDSGYPDLVSQPTGCDVSITRTTTGTYSVSAESRGTTVNSGTEIEIDLASTVEGSLKTDSVTVIQQANALVSSTGYTITSVTLNGVNDDIYISKYAQSITVLGSGTYTKTYTSGASESANFNLGASDISVSGTGFSYSNFTISVAANSGAERTCTVTASYSGATNVTRTITQAMGIVAPTVSLDTRSLSGNTLTLKASILSAGGGTITACGFEWGFTSSLGNTVTATTVQSGQFTADVLVIAGQTIYWRAFATNEAGTTYTTITNYTHSGTPIEE